MRRVGFNISTFIYLSVGAGEQKSLCFTTSLLHHALSKVASVLVFFVIFENSFELIGIQEGLHKLPLAISIVFTIVLIFFAVSCLQSMTRRSLTVGIIILSYCLHFHFSRSECPCSRRRPDLPKLMWITIIINL